MENPGPQRKVSFSFESSSIDNSTQESIPATFITGVDLEELSIEDYKDEDDQEFLSEIMMCLDANRVAELRQEFLKAEDGLTLNDFVQVMKATLPKSENYAFLVKAGLTKLQLISNLCELFLTIDVNGDGQLEWEEFTSFIVEMGIAGHDHQPDAIQHYRCTGQVDVGRITTYIDQIYYFPENDTVVLVNLDSTSFRIFNPAMQFKKEINRPEGVVRCIDYIPKDHCYVVCSSDLSISFYEEHSGALLKTFRTQSSQVCMTWVEKHQILYTADTMGAIHAWDIEEMDEKFCMVRGSEGLEGHTDIVLQLLVLQGLDMLATASMDTSIRLWDLGNGKHKRQLKGHTKGVRSITYSPEYRFLVSGGFDFNVFVWNPYVEHLILRLHGHGAALGAVQVVSCTPQLITADVEGNFRVWDIRNFSCIQIFQGEECQGILKGFKSIPKYKRMIAAGRRVSLYEHLKMDNPDLTDNASVVAAKYNATSLTIMTVSGQTVKVWDARDGKLSRVYRNPSQGELTCLCFDSRQRKFILGDHTGRLSVYNYLNGAKMKSFEYSEFQMKAHVAEIVKVVYCPEHSTVISASWDGSIAIHDERLPDQGCLLRKMTNGHEDGDVMQLAHSFNLSLVASGASDGSVMIWDYEMGRSYDEMFGHVAPITALLFMDPYPLLLAADGNGNLALWGQRPCEAVSGRCVLRWRNRAWNDNVGSYAMVPVQVLSTHIERITAKERSQKEYIRMTTTERDEIGGKRYNEAQHVVNLVKETTQGFKKYLVFGGDEAGNITAWDLLPVLTYLERTHFGPKGLHALDEPYPCVNPYRNLRYSAKHKDDKMRRRRMRGRTTPLEELQNQAEREKVMEQQHQQGKPQPQGPTLTKQRSSAKVNEPPSLNLASVLQTFDEQYDLIGKDAPFIKSVHTWKAHSDVITSVEVLPEGKGLLSAGMDKLVKMWSFEGECLGILKQKSGGTNGIEWTFAPDVQAHRARKEAVARQVKADLDQRQHEEEQVYLMKGGSRVPLLEMARVRHAKKLQEEEERRQKEEEEQYGNQEKAPTRPESQVTGIVPVSGRSKNSEMVSREIYKKPYEMEDLEDFVVNEDTIFESLADWRTSSPSRDDTSLVVGAKGMVFKASEIPYSHESYRKTVLAKKHNPNLRPVNPKNAGKTYLHGHRRLKHVGKQIVSKSAR